MFNDVVICIVDLVGNKIYNDFPWKQRTQPYASQADAYAYTSKMNTDYRKSTS